MKRCTFCKSAVAAGITATLPACGGSTSDSASIDAISTAGAEISLEGFYTNLNDEDERDTWGNYGANYPRLAELKAKYDPENLFRLNANIKPAT